MKGGEGSDSYLERTRKTADRKAFPSSVRPLFQGSHVIPEDLQAFKDIADVQKVLRPFSKQEWQNEGTVDFVISGDEVESPRVSIEYDSTIGPEFRFIYGQDRSESYRRLRNLTIKGGEKSYDLKKDIGNKWSIYILAKHRASLSSDAHTLPTKRVIKSDHDIMTPIGLYAFLHEIGHANIEAAAFYEANNLQKVYKKKHNKDILSDSEKKLVIESERKADAYALNVLRKFVDKKDIDSMYRKLAYVSQDAYHTHFGASRVKKTLDEPDVV